MIQKQYTLKSALLFVVISIPFLSVINCLGSKINSGWIGYPSNSCFHFVCNVRNTMLTFSYPPKKLHQIWISKFLWFYIVVQFFCGHAWNFQINAIEILVSAFLACCFICVFVPTTTSTTLFSERLEKYDKTAKIQSLCASLNCHFFLMVILQKIIRIFWQCLNFCETESSLLLSSKWNFSVTNCGTQKPYRPNAIQR